MARLMKAMASTRRLPLVGVVAMEVGAFQITPSPAIPRHNRRVSGECVTGSVVRSALPFEDRPHRAIASECGKHVLRMMCRIAVNEAFF
jgi:hypothetical protein